jgi:indolepyruvate ferredoxin oxidoreductase alpha subunit
MAVNQAIKKLKLKPDQVMVTGDIGCTILGMNPPFNTVWNEVSMGASVSLAQGFVRAGVKTPVIATIGDSTFFHGGMPGLVNALQHDANLTLIVMDNLWTAMTGMQVNAGTPCDLQSEGVYRVDLARILPALGVEHFFVMDPFDLETSAATVQLALKLPGVKVILARRECAIPANRRETQRAEIKVVPENCNLCKLCLMITGCSALGLGEGTVTIDEALCTGCGLCLETCNRDALLEVAA